jgi:hypothetical protein
MPAAGIKRFAFASYGQLSQAWQSLNIYRNTFYMEALIFFNWYSASSAPRGLSSSGIRSAIAVSSALGAIDSIATGVANRSTWTCCWLAWTKIAAQLGRTHVHVDGGMVGGAATGQLFTAKQPDFC